MQMQSYLHERAAVRKCDEWVETTTATAKGATQQPTTPTPSCLSQDETRHVASPQQDIGCDGETFVLDNSVDMEVHVNNEREALSQIALNRSSLTGLPLEDSTEWTVGSLSRVCMLRTFLEGTKKRPQQPHLDENEESRRRNVRTARTTLHSSIEPTSEGVFRHMHTRAARELLKSCSS